MQALCCAKLQELSVFTNEPQTPCIAQVWPALKQLSRLTSLTLVLPDLDSTCVNSAGSVGLPGAVSSLQLLVKLRCESLPVELSEHLCQKLPASLQGLTMVLLHGRHEVQLGHLSSLVHLTVPRGGQPCRRRGCCCSHIPVCVAPTLAST